MVDYKKVKVGCRVRYRWSPNSLSTIELNLEPMICELEGIITCIEHGNKIYLDNGDEVFINAIIQIINNKRKKLPKIHDRAWIMRDTAEHILKKYLKVAKTNIGYCIMDKENCNICKISKEDFDILEKVF